MDLGSRVRLGLAAVCVALARRGTLMYTLPHRPQRVRGRPGPSPDKPKPFVICHRRRGDGVRSRQDVQAQVDSGALAASHRRSDAERVGWEAAGEPCRRQGSPQPAPEYIAEAATPSEDAWAREQARYRAKNESDRHD